MQSFTTLCLPAFAALAIAMQAIVVNGQNKPLVANRGPSESEQHLTGWRSAHGGSWQTIEDEQTHRTRFLFGGSAAPPFTPAEEADYIELGWHFLGETHALHGVDLDTLVPDEVVYLPLALAGSSDKMTVRFRQEIGGVPIRAGSVNVLFDLEGRLLSIDEQALPLLSGFDPRPERPASEAEAIAREWFAADNSAAPTDVRAAELVVEQYTVGSLRHPELAWAVKTFWSIQGASPLGYLYLVSARGPAIRLGRENLVHEDVKGTVSTMASPGALPDASYNPEVALPMQNLTITSSSGSATTTSSGSFTFSGPGQVTATFTFAGPYATVSNESGADMSTTLVLSGTANSILLNPNSTAQFTAMANAYFHINYMRSWVKAVNPTDTKPDFTAVAEVNHTWTTCNAKYYGDHMEFMAAGGGCPNTAYSTVIDHELGHWYNDRYGSGNGGDGFGEGAADVWAMYVMDSQWVGLGMGGTSTSYVRSGENTTTFCGDANLGCYKDSEGNTALHKNGEVLMGAIWKVRKHLNTSLGNAAGDAVANLLLNGWMNAYDDSQIKSIIESHWLVLDDNDANLFNGTPHYAEINQGFLDQGFPGYPALPASQIWVDVAWGGSELGTSFFPFDTLIEGVFMVKSGGYVFTRMGSYLENLTLSKPMTIEAVGGSVVIGD